MAEQHRATDSEWYCLEARTCGSKSDGVAYSTILELRDRIEALETRNEDDKEAWAARLRRPGRSQAERIASLAERITSLQERIEALEVAHRGQPNHPEIPNSSLERRVSEHIKAQSVLTAALVKRLEALEGVPLDGAVPAKVPGGLPALAEKVKALEVAHRGRPNHEELPDSSLVHRVARAMNGATEWQARAAIREVADWMRENPDVHFPPALVFALEREAEL